MSLVVGVLIWALQIYFWLLIARFLVDLVLSANPAWRPKGLILVLVEIVFTVTDPPLKFARRFIKPTRLGSISLDFAWTAVLITVSLLQSVLRTLV